MQTSRRLKEQGWGASACVYVSVYSRITPRWKFASKFHNALPMGSQRNLGVRFEGEWSKISISILLLLLLPVHLFSQNQLPWCKQCHKVCPGA